MGNAGGDDPKRRSRHWLEHPVLRVVGALIALTLGPVFGSLLTGELRDRGIESLTDACRALGDPRVLKLVLGVLGAMIGAAMAVTANRIKRLLLAVGGWLANLVRRVWRLCYPLRLRLRHRLILTELLTTGFSRTLERVDPKGCARRRVRYDSFYYSVGDLLQDMEAPRADRQMRHMELSEDGGFKRGAGPAAFGPCQKIAGGEPYADRAWAIYGPRVELRRPGRYLVVFRLRATRGPDRSVRSQRLVCDVKYNAATEFPRGTQTEREVTISSGSYVPVCLEFVSDGETDLEFRVHALRQKQPAEEVADIVIDTISVLRLGD